MGNQPDLALSLQSIDDLGDFADLLDSGLFSAVTEPVDSFVSDSTDAVDGLLLRIFQKLDETVESERSLEQKIVDAIASVNLDADRLVRELGEVVVRETGKLVDEIEEPVKRLEGKLSLIHI